ncbi:MAG: retron Ec67 family RNA-directed DNA polymerase/endonuclease [Lachnospira pectinoschiza]|jgi:RNA-directed DNA polymerase
MVISDIESREQLAFLLNIPLSKLTYLLYVKRIDNCYTSFDIKKKNNGVRVISAPNEDLKDIQRKLGYLLELHHKAFLKEKNIDNKISHGFEKNKSIITNAAVHRNNKYILSIDIKDFFDSIHFGRVRGFFNKNIEFNLPLDMATVMAQLVCYKGVLPQGAPTSPIVSNLICNILDIRILNLVKKYRMNYTRYADDMTFSTNDRCIVDNYDGILEEIANELGKFGLHINDKKTRLIYKDSRQEVTGLVVNKIINVNRHYCKKTRAMAENLYRKGSFYIGDEEGSIKQLEGRFAYINQLDYYNNKRKGEKKDCWHLNSREKNYQKFLYYRYFFNNEKPLIVTEGKTDILYLKSALKKMYDSYPNLISKTKNGFEFKVSFLKRSKRLEYFFNINQDGADTIKNVLNMYTGQKGFANYYKYFKDKSEKDGRNPVILIFDNEQNTDRPLKKFKKDAKIQDVNIKNWINISGNLYLVTNPIVNGKDECEIEDLFSESTLNTLIGGKSFSRNSKSENDKYYGKAIFADYVMKNYQKIDFSNFVPFLDSINSVLDDYQKNNLIRPQ